MVGRVSQKRDERRRENAANTALPVASAVRAVYRAAICEKEREKERKRYALIMVITLFARAARKNVFRGNQRRSEPAPVNEPRRFFLTDIVTVKSESTPAVAQTTTGRRHL